jgi:FkbM family methyltransferase
LASHSKYEKSGLNKGESKEMQLRVIEFVRNLMRAHQILLKSYDEKVLSIIYPLQVGLLEWLYFSLRHSPECLIFLPYGTKCLYNASDEAVGGSIFDVVFNKEYFSLDSYKPAKGNVIIDCGAFAGIYTIMASRLVGDDGHVVAIEPEPRSFGLLTKNVKRNGLKNVSLLNLALSNQIGKKDFYIQKIASRSSFYPPNLITEDYAKTRVKVQTLDNLINTNVDIMKIDVEGAELSVLEGACNALEKGLVDKLIVEVHKRINGVETISKFLNSYGYMTDSYFDINRDKGILYSRLV